MCCKSDASEDGLT